MRESIAAIQHSIWAHWMEYLFTVGERNADGTITLPAVAVAAWERLILTPYEYLSESQKISDREQADKVLAILPGSMK